MRAPEVQNVLSFMCSRRGICSQGHPRVTLSYHHTSLLLLVNIPSRICDEASCHAGKDCSMIMIAVVTT
jgi:hypothetical protein